VPEPRITRIQVSAERIRVFSKLGSRESAT